jgi:proteasome regulatory subunit
MEKTSQNILKKIEDLKKEIKILKEDNAKTKRNLMWKVRKLEKDKLLIENEKMRLDREVKSLRRN